MAMQITGADLEIILKEADVAARRLVFWRAFPWAELLDVRQDLLADLIARMRRFDPSRGSIGAFAGTVLLRRSMRLAAIARRNRTHRLLLSSSAPFDTRNDGNSNPVPEEKSYSTEAGGYVDPFEQLERWARPQAMPAHPRPSRSDPLCTPLATDADEARRTPQAWLARNHLSAPAQNPETTHGLRTWAHSETFLGSASSSLYGHRLAPKHPAQCC